MQTLSILVALSFASNIFSGIMNIYKGTWFFGIPVILQCLPLGYIAFSAYQVFIQDDSIINRAKMALGYRVNVLFRLLVNLLCLTIFIIAFIVIVNNPEYK